MGIPRDMKLAVAISGKIASGKTTCSKYLIEKYRLERVSCADQLKEIAEWFLVDGKKREIDWDELWELLENLYSYDHDYPMIQSAKMAVAFQKLQEQIWPLAKGIKWPAPGQEIDWTVDKPQPVRHLLQALGTDVIRNQVDSNTWARSTAQRAATTLDLRWTQGVVIDDIRFPDEFRALRQEGFVMVRLVVSQNMQVERLRKQFETDENCELSNDEFAKLFNLDHRSETALDDEAEKNGFDIYINGNQPLNDMLAELDKKLHAPRS